MKKVILFCSLFFFVSQVCFAQIPQTISYQGIMKNAADSTAVGDGTYEIIFKIYADSTSGSSLWDESQDVEVSGGLFNVILGSSDPLDLTFDEQYWLGIAIGDGSELTPRTILTSSPYSLNAQTVADNAITSSKIMDGNVVRSINSITDNVTLAEGENISIIKTDGTLTISASGDSIYADDRYVNEEQESSITSSMIQDGAVETYDISNSSVTTSKISSSGATSDQAIMYDGSKVVWKTPPTSVGDITAVYAGTGMTGGGTSGDVTLNLDTNYTDGQYVNEGQSNSITSSMITNGVDELSGGDIRGNTYIDGTLSAIRIKAGSPSSSNLDGYITAQYDVNADRDINAGDDLSAGDDITAGDDIFCLYGTLNAKRIKAGSPSSSNLDGYITAQYDVNADRDINAGDDINVGDDISIGDALNASRIRTGTPTAPNYTGDITSDSDIIADQDIIAWDDLHAMDDITCNGTKYAIIQTANYGKRLTAADESAEVYLFDRGQAQLVNGESTIELEPIFLETVTINADYPMIVQITLTSDCNGVFVSEKTPTSFTVKELLSGTSNASFDWEMAAKRMGYEDDRLEEYIRED